MTDGAQKFIARNRAPRVQIEYDVELYGSEKKVQLPFVMGVMSDLAGKSEVAQPAIADRQFLEIDVDNFDDRMKAMRPRAAFSVPNTLTGEGNLSVDLTFEKMDDFTPAAIAAKIEPLRELLQARTQLSDLMTYMDGKVGAETLIEKVMADPTLLAAISQSGPDADMTRSALDSLRALDLPETENPDTSSDVLDALRATAPRDGAPEDNTDSVLAGLSKNTVEESPSEDASSGVLDALRQSAPDDQPESDSSAEVLESLRSPDEAEAELADTRVDDALATLTPAPDGGSDEAGGSDDATADVLANLSKQPEDAPAVEDEAPGVLEGLRAAAPESTAEPDTSSDVLDGLRAETPDEEMAPDTHVADTLAGLAPPPAEPEPDDLDAVLSTVPEASDSDPQEEPRDAILSDLSASGPDPVDDPDTVGAALDSLPDPADQEDDQSGADNILSGLAAAPVESRDSPDIETRLADAAGSMAVPETAEEEPAADDVLSDLAQEPVPDAIDDTDITSRLAEATEGIAAPVGVETDPSPEAVLSGLTPVAEPDEPDGVDLDDVLAGLSEPDAGTETPDQADDVLAGLADVAVSDTPPSDSVGAALDSLSGPDPDEPQTDDVETAPQTLSDDPGAEASNEPSHGAPAPVSDDLLPPSDMSDDTDPVSGPDSDVDIEDGGDLDDLLGDLDAATETSSEAEPGPPEAAPDDTTLLQNDDDDGLPGDGLDDLDDLLAAPEETSAPDPDTDADTEFDDLLGELDATPEPPSQTDAAPSVTVETADAAGEFEVGDTVPPDDGTDDLDDLLGDLGAAEPENVQASEAGSSDVPGSNEEAPADALPAETDTDDLDDLDDLLGDLDASPDAGTEEERATGADASEENAQPDVELDDLDDLLGDLDADLSPSATTEPEDPTDSSQSDAGLDDLLGDLGAEDPGEEKPEAAHMTDAAEIAFGTMTGDRPSPEQLKRRRFRIAILGDFSGRAARGVLETGDDLAARRAILLDPDTVEDVIAGFAAPLVLPIGKEGAGVEVPLGGLDDLHPDELYENVALFPELSALRARLASGATADSAKRDLLAWGETHGTPVKPTRSRSSGNAVPADRRLSDFQKLIGDTSATLTEPSPLEDLMARVVGPHIRAVPDADAVAMQGAVDEALSAAMRLVLHHPEFQSVESQWRSLDLIARSIETNDTLEVNLYDVSAEEIAADLANAAELGQSGFARLLTEGPLDEETGRGGYSALIGLYSFEETPPHADLLGRIARVAAHVDAPFLAAISPAFLETEKDDRHPMVADAWDQLRAMPEAGHLGLASPRFLLRRPYGQKSEPIYEFPFEEFTMAAGLGGMLWANPVVLVTILLAKSFRENGASMGLGSIMSLGGMPYHVVNDRFGDQVALPCTERNLTLEKVEKVMTRGLMPVVSIKGRDEIRLASFQSLAGGDILGPWSGVAPPPPSPPKPKPEPASQAEPEEDDDLGLDDLLAEFDDATTETPDADSDDIDADLAALLEDL